MSADLDVMEEVPAGGGVERVAARSEEHLLAFGEAVRADAALELGVWRGDPGDPGVAGDDPDTSDAMAGLTTTPFCRHSLASTSSEYTSLFGWPVSMMKMPSRTKTRAHSCSGGVFRGSGMGVMPGSPGSMGGGCIRGGRGAMGGQSMSGSISHRHWGAAPDGLAGSNNPTSAATRAATIRLARVLR
jgi:hypothetical protein